MKGGKKRVLVVDDTKQILVIMQRMLRGYGLSVDTAEGGREAIELFFLAMQTGMPYDLAILDLQMPDMNGAEVLAELKKLDRATKAVLHSSAVGSEVYANYLDFGFIDRLYKPSGSKEILALITRVLG